MSEWIETVPFWAIYLLAINFVLIVVVVRLIGAVKRLEDQVWALRQLWVGEGDE